MQFHSSFERCVSRVLYKGEWSTSRPAIMKHNQWDKCSSEVLIRYATFPSLLHEVLLTRPTLLAALRVVSARHSRKLPPP